jgi:hypothetical protein
VAGQISYIKLYNVGQKVVTRRCSGYIPSHVAFHLMNVHISPRKIWLSRHSESPDQVAVASLAVPWFMFGVAVVVVVVVAAAAAAVLPLSLNGCC